IFETFVRDLEISLHRQTAAGMVHEKWFTPLPVLREVSRAVAVAGVADRPAADAGLLDRETHADEAVDQALDRAARGRLVGVEVCAVVMPGGFGVRFELMGDVDD